ncbi:23S rRNA (adenine(2030)-N(6))-methyltransferase RlmJ, partial [Salmonella enterica subsp. enterica serovar Montevideo]|nr:23S rRNA (adenine(2030)-N(6))-methyltransferase RlmJ [Salmonella enterica subsp. enterica serovar Montevideo]
YLRFLGYKLKYVRNITDIDDKIIKRANENGESFVALVDRMIAVDSLQLTELHPSDFPLLRAEFQKDNRARVERADGYQQLKAKLP